MSGAISGAAWDLTHTLSRWMGPIWEIAEYTLTPRFRLQRATITPDRWIGPPPTKRIAHGVHTSRTRTPTHNQSVWTDCGTCNSFMCLTLKFTWSLVSQGCEHREEKGRVWSAIREFILCLSVCVCAHTVWIYCTLARRFICQRETNIQHYRFVHGTGAQL